MYQNEFSFPCYIETKTLRKSRPSHQFRNQKVIRKVGYFGNNKNNNIFVCYISFRIILNSQIKINIKVISKEKDALKVFF